MRVACECQTDDKETPWDPLVTVPLLPVWKGKRHRADVPVYRTPRVPRRTDDTRTAPGGPWLRARASILYLPTSLGRSERRRGPSNTTKFDEGGSVTQACSERTRALRPLRFILSLQCTGYVVAKTCPRQAAALTSPVPVRAVKRWHGAAPKRRRCAQQLRSETALSA